MFRWRDGQQDAIHQTNIKRGITSSFARALKILQQKHLQFSEEEFIYSNDASNNLCSSLEAAFLHGLKDSVAQKLTSYVGLTVVPDQTAGMNFWSVVAKFTHSDVVTQLQKLTQISTEIGLCRAWVRLALNDGLMESYLHSMIVDTKALKYFYHSYSYLRDHEQPGILRNYLTGLMSLDFKLSYNSSVLNYWNNSTLQLIGTLDTLPAPSPAIRPTERGHSGLNSVHPKNSAEKDQKVEDPTVTTKVAQTTSQSQSPSTFASTQDVEDLQHVAATKNDSISSLALSVSEGSSSSHVSCPDPDGVASGTNINLLDAWSREKSVVSSSARLGADIDSLSDIVNISTFSDYHDNYGEQGGWDGTENQDTQKTEGCASDEKAERSQKPYIITEEASPLCDSPTRPRSRRVGEEDIKHIFSSSFSSPFNSEKANATHSGFVLSEDIQDIVFRSSTCPHRSSYLDAPQKRPISPERSKELTHAVKENQKTQQIQSLEGDDKSRTKVFEEIYPIVPPEKLEKKVVCRTLNDHGSQVFRDSENKGSQPEDKASNPAVVKSSDSMLPGSDEKRSQAGNDMSSQKKLEHSPIPESSFTYLHEADGSTKSSPVSSNRDNQSGLHSLDDKRHSTNSRTRHEDYINIEHSQDTDKKNSQAHKHSYHSIVHHSTKNDRDSPVLDQAEELATSKVQRSNKTSQQDKELEEAEAEFELSMSPSRYGNSLNSLSGWSSEIESKRERRKPTRAEKSRAESFASMLHTYTPASSVQPRAVTLDEVIGALPCETEDNNLDEDQKSGEVSPSRNAGNTQVYFIKRQKLRYAPENLTVWEDSGLENFEVLKSPSEFFCGQVEANGNSQKDKQFVSKNLKKIGHHY